MSDPIKKDEVAVIRRTPRSFSLMPESFGEAKEIANMIAMSDFAPKDYKGKSGNVIIAIQMGADLGLKPMQALQNIAVINGRPSIYGDAALALVLGANILEDFQEFYEGEEGSDKFTAVCIAKRKGMATAVRRTFSVADAKAAGLWMKKGHNGGDTPWVTYPKRMLLFRARGFTLRDVASDVLMGLILVEEAQDYPTVIDVTPHAGELPPVPILEQLPEADREHIVKAFDLCNLPSGLRLTKVNEFLGGDGVDRETGIKELLDWCRDEFSKQKTGQPRKVEGNGKKVATDSGGTKTAGEHEASAQGTDGIGSVAGHRGYATNAAVDPKAPAPSAPQAQVTEPLTADEIFGSQKGETLKEQVGF